jgi:hypothetical protein
MRKGLLERMVKLVFKDMKDKLIKEALETGNDNIIAQNV